MDIRQMIESGSQVNVTVSVADLREFAMSLIEEARKMEAANAQAVDAELTASDVRRQLGVSAGTLWRWEREGYLVPCGRIGKRPIYRQSQLDAMKAAN